jgi:hypothetical protein
MDRRRIGHLIDDKLTRQLFDNASLHCMDTLDNVVSDRLYAEENGLFLAIYGSLHCSIVEKVFTEMPSGPTF